jgi:hypothetical protein
MQRRFLFSALLAGLALSAAACADESPVFTGGEQFPPGALPVTREVIVPASQFFSALGAFSGYSSAFDAPYLVVANQFDEGLNANALANFVGFPTTVSYSAGGTEKRDAAFRYLDSRLVLRVDTAATTAGPVTFQVYQAAQNWDAASATWTTAIDSGAVKTAWTQPGGTRGALLAEGTFVNDAASGDSVVLTLTGAEVAALADTAADGVVITTSTAGGRAELFELVLRASIKPDSASPDTTIVTTLTTAGLRTTVYTPEQPDAPAGFLAVGGIRSARALLELRPDQQVPACAEGQSCGTVPLTEVELNQVALLLRPGEVPRGFDPLSAVPLSLRLIQEPELGAAAPLGAQVLDADASRSFSRVYFYTPGDTVVTLPITGLAGGLAANDSLPRTYALLSEIDGRSAPPTFGVAFFAAEPRLRIIYTLPARRPLP